MPPSPWSTTRTWPRPRGSPGPAGHGWCRRRTTCSTRSTPSTCAPGPRSTHVWWRRWRRGACPVFCEKPLATDLASAQAMVGAVAEAGVVNQVGLVPAGLTRLPVPAPPGRPARERPGHERRAARRPVPPQPGPLRLDLAGRPDQGRLGSAARALDPRPRHPRVDAGSHRRGHGQLPRVPPDRRHRGRVRRHPGVRVRGPRLAGLDLARPAGAAQPAPGGGHLRAGPTSGSRTTCGVRCTGPCPGDDEGSVGGTGPRCLALGAASTSRCATPTRPSSTAWSSASEPASPDFVPRPARAHLVAADALYRSPHAASSSTSADAAPVLEGAGRQAGAAGPVTPGCRRRTSQGGLPTEGPTSGGLPTTGPNQVAASNRSTTTTGAA